MLNVLQIKGQNSENKQYYLPQTAIQIIVDYEKSTLKPGEFSDYAKRYLRQTATDVPTDNYRLLSIKMNVVGTPDTSKTFTLSIERHPGIENVQLTSDGRLMGINLEEDAVYHNNALPTGTITISAPQPEAPNPRNYMTEDILRAGSKAKMAELTAQEIYDIRDSRNRLTRGEADNLPKDAGQLKIMMDRLDAQEKALTSLFMGLTTTDTLRTVMQIIPTKQGKNVIFRFSKRLGMLSGDDGAGEPYYLNIKTLGQTVDKKPIVDNKEKKDDKADIGLRTALPQQIEAAVFSLNETLAKQLLAAPQMGSVEEISGDIFGKKQSARLTIDPTTGALVKLEQFTPTKK